MGKVAPTYINLVMDYLELKMYEKSEDNFGHQFYQKDLIKTGDDILMTASFYVAEYLNKFKELINSINQSLQLTMELSMN